MSYDFVPGGPAGETSKRMTADEQRAALRDRQAVALARFDAWSRHGRGYLLVSTGTLTFHPHHGEDVLHTETTVTVATSGLRTRVDLHGSYERLTVSLPRWQHGRLVRALRDAGLTLTDGAT